MNRKGRKEEEEIKGVFVVVKKPLLKISHPIRVHPRSSANICGKKNLC